MNVTGKTVSVSLPDRQFVFCNQRCPEWTHPYPWQGQGDLHDSGCGIFSLVHLARFWLGAEISPETLADFSCRFGGRGDDGTDRPALLAAMETQGLSRSLGFSYRMDGLRNDLDTLKKHLENGGAALCNLRQGHIVALSGIRDKGGETQALVLDSYCESADPRVLPSVRECLAGSEIVYPVVNAAGVSCGFVTGYGVYWAVLSTVRDFNLLYPSR
ncbi:MAG: hypothetical protein IKQ41_02385 [Clostridia bacterium]|nr:hypothetical protein [Clostridia bacterium]